MHDHDAMNERSQSRSHPAMCPAAHCLILICISVQHHVCSFNRSCAVPRHLFSCGSLNFPMCSSLSSLALRFRSKGGDSDQKEKVKGGASLPCADCARRYSVQYSPDGSLNAGKFRARFNQIGFNCDLRSVGWYGSMNAPFLG